MLRLLGWAFREVPTHAETVVCILDWMSAHCDKSIDDLLHSKRHSVLRIPGCITDCVQVPDTHRHYPWSAAYKQAERRDADHHWRTHPTGILPCSSRQTVQHRAEDTWRELRHDNGEREWKENGIGLALDGSEDWMLRNQIIDDCKHDPLYSS